MPGTLYLVPTGLGTGEVIPFLPPATLERVRGLAHFVAENPKSARAFLKAIAHPLTLQSIDILTLDEHTDLSRLPQLLQPLAEGADMGLLSDAGCPAVADPGAALVRAAHAASIEVVPLVGPSSLLLALMASGLNGQRFAFHGYLPVERAARAKRLAEIESESERRDQTQLFIEAPYRNEAMLEAILEACRGDTLLAVASELTCEGESVRTLEIAQWKRNRPAIDRRPTVFLLYRAAPARPQKR